MAFKPSKNSKKEIRVEELELTPVMNLMVMLIPFMLLSVEFIRLSIIESTAPEVSDPSEMVAQQDQPDEEPQKSLDLTVFITKEGFTLAASIGVVSNQEEGAETGGPTVPLKEGTYDYEKLTEMLVDIREKVDEMADIDEKKKYSVILMPYDQLLYADLIRTMDATRETTIDGNRKWLFPNVAISGSFL
jgi:biopolymer transport protein ExbD